jgi:hypothetical protein
MIDDIMMYEQVKEIKNRALPMPRMALAWLKKGSTLLR